jgi:hypothetical protein
MLTSLAIKEMQIKTTLRFYLTLLKWLPSRTQTTTNVGEDMGKGTLINCCWEWKLV